MFRGRGVDKMTHPSGAPRASYRMVEGQAGPNEAQRGQVKAQHHPALPSKKQRVDPWPPVNVSSSDSHGSFTTTPLTLVLGGYTTGTQAL